jgi:hypothetical protein
MVTRQQFQPRRRSFQLGVPREQIRYMLFGEWPKGDTCPFDAVLETLPVEGNNLVPLVHQNTAQFRALNKHSPVQAS